MATGLASRFDFAFDDIIKSLTSDDGIVLAQQQLEKMNVISIT